MTIYALITGLVCFVTYAITAAVWRCRLYGEQERLMASHRKRQSEFRRGLNVARGYEGEQGSGTGGGSNA